MSLRLCKDERDLLGSEGKIAHSGLNVKAECGGLSLKKIGIRGLSKPLDRPGCSYYTWAM
jgi:hypothetical protein